MRQTRIFVAVLLILSAVSAMAWGGHNLRAVDLENIKDYAGAAREWRLHADEMEDSFYNNANPELFVLDWVKAIHNEIECAYMYDDFGRVEDRLEWMKRVMDVFDYIVEADSLKGDAGEYMGRSINAMYYKSLGAYLYLYAEYDDSYESSDYCYRMALYYADPEDEDFIATVNNELAQLHYKQGLEDNSADHYAKALDYIRKTGDNSALTLSQTAMITARLGETANDDNEAARYFDSALSQISQAIDLAGKKSDEYPEMLRKKGKILMLQGQRLNLDNYRKARSCYEDYLDHTKKDIAARYPGMTESQRQQAWLGAHRFMYDVCRLGNRASDLIYDLALFSKGYLLRPQKSKVHHWRDVAKALKDDEAAIEFFAFDGNLKALVVDRKSKSPEMIDICRIDSFMSTELPCWDDVGFLIRDNTGPAKNSLYGSSVVANTIWSNQLMQRLDGKKKVYFSPDGFLHQLAIEYIVPGEKFDAYRLSSTSRLLEPRKMSSSSMLLCGGISYYADVDTASTLRNDEDAFAAMKGCIFNFLPGTDAEVDSIESVRRCLSDSVLTRGRATEQNFMKMAPDYNMLHIATHGSFSGTTSVGNDLRAPLSDKAMSHSLIAMAGCSANLTNSYFDPKHLDGLISAAEMSRADLSDVSLAVLSACQTGRGYLTDDGVYGMQRGLKMAGVGGMLVSLWNVDDFGTCKLMQLFYEELGKTPDSPYTALKNARQRMKGVIPENKRHYNAAKMSQAIKGYINASATDGEMYYGAPRYTNAFIGIDLF